MRASSSVRLTVETLEAREVPATMLAVNAAGRLLSFDSNNPSVLLSRVNITGLSFTGELITDIDVRPGSGALFGRSTADRFYIINPTTGAATPLGGIFNTPSGTLGMDFDPTADRIRVVGNNGENLSFNPNNGTVSSIGASLTYLPGDFAAGQTPRVVGLGFTNSLPFALTTTAYGIDHIQNTLVQFSGPRDNGQLVTVGSLGFDVTALVGFDIAPGDTVGFAALRLPGAAFSLFCQVNLSTGVTTSFGPIGPNRLIRDIAILSGSSFPSGGFLFPTLPPSNTAPLFPPLVQPLAPGLVSPGFGFFGSTITTGGSASNQFSPT
jgi:hypothetical protein